MFVLEMFTTKSLYDAVEPLKSVNVTVGKWIEHVSEEIACPPFYKALDEKVPLQICRIEARWYKEVYTICLVLDTTDKFPGFDVLSKDYKDIAFCYPMSKEQYDKVLTVFCL